MSAYTTIELTREGPVGRVWLNQPASHNALSEVMIAELAAAFRELAADEAVRVVVLGGRGASFCAGADVAMMVAAGSSTFEQNIADGKALYDLMACINECPKPVVGRVHGYALGGGVGLVACCDIALAAPDTTFGFSEVRLGIVAGVISPFVVAKIGAGQARALFLSGERFDAARALRIGLVHRLAPAAGDLDEVVSVQITELLRAAPEAQAVAKRLVSDLGRTEPDALRGMAAEVIARRRASAEGQEGLRAFLEKRPPSWSRG
jgi:methylglutaconyl-CoA hydratase